MLLENIYGKGVTHDDFHMTIHMMIIMCYSTGHKVTRIRSSWLIALVIFAIVLLPSWQYAKLILNLNSKLSYA
jgi:hypothetical protein